MSILNPRTALGAVALALALIATLVAGTVSCTAESRLETPKRHGAAPAEDEGGHAHGPHDGVVEPIGNSTGHVEIVHDAETGCVDLYILAADKKTPAKPDAAPAINLKTKAGPKQVASEAADGEGHYRAVDDALKGAHPSGQIVVKMGGKDYLVILVHHHHGDDADPHEEGDSHEHGAEGDGHDHDGEDHAAGKEGKGHDHDGHEHAEGHEHGKGEPAHK